MVIDLEGRVPTKADLQQIVNALSRCSTVHVVNAYRPTKVHEDLELLTSAELKVFWLVLRGCTNKEIAFKIDATEQVVKNALRKIYIKLNIPTSGARLKLVIRYGFHLGEYLHAQPQRGSTEAMRQQALL